MALRIRQVYAFVDWDTARRLRWLPPSVARSGVRSLDVQLKELYMAIARGCKALCDDRCMVRVRLYHGWHQGKTPTQDYRDLAAIQPRRLAFGDLSVAFEPPQIADSLLCGGRHASLRNTLRKRENALEHEQKLVDTALAADLLFLARQHSTNKDADFLVVSEDDDMIPPVVVAQQWGLSCKILRVRDSKSRCVDHLDRLLIPMTSEYT